MKYRVEVGLALFLLLFLFSLGDPLIYLGGLLRRAPALAKAADVQCLLQSVPAQASALFFSNPDGSLDWNAYNFIATRTQYELAPRPVAVVVDARADLAAYPYLLAYNLDPAALADLSAQANRRLLQTCGKTAVLGPAR
jgi:hypothetical protein